MPLPLYCRGNSPRYILYKILGGPQSRSWRYGQEILLPLTVIEPLFLGGPSCSLVSLPTELSEFPILHVLLLNIPCSVRRSYRRTGILTHLCSIDLLQNKPKKVERHNKCTVSNTSRCLLQPFSDVLWSLRCFLQNQSNVIQNGF
jgi:hypothetical protein